LSSKPRILAIIPARGGSKGIPLKNLKTVAGKTLLARTLELAQSIPEITEICVSTDHPEIRDAALAFNGVTVVDRPAELSGDRVADSPVLQHATTEMEKSSGKPFDVVVMLQVTSPLRTIDDVTESIAKLVLTGCDAVWTVSPTELHFHPLKQLVLGKDSTMRMFDKRGLRIIARQQLDPVFHRNGCCYALRRDFLMSADGLFSPDSSYAIISKGERVNIDTEEDLVRAEELLVARENS
jgi:CMP-N-acetylneuraminic acid synthetase